MRRSATAGLAASDAEFVACHQFNLLEKIDVLQVAAEGATFLLNSPYPADRVWDQLPREVQQQIISKRLRFYVVDGHDVARQTGMGGRINIETDDVAEIQSLGRTLAAWRTEILAHHDTGASNGPTEGLNLCVKKVKRAGHGFRSFEHYRIRVLLLPVGLSFATFRAVDQLVKVRLEIERRRAPDLDAVVADIADSIAGNFKASGVVREEASGLLISESVAANPPTSTRNTIEIKTVTEFTYPSSTRLEKIQ